MNYSRHARERMGQEHRGVSEADVQALLDAPLTVEPSYRERTVYTGAVGTRLIGVVLTNETPPTVVTIYVIRG